MDHNILSNKTIVIIGGTTGIGLSGARACMKAGAQLVVIGLDEAHINSVQALLGDNAYVMIGDARDPHTAETAIHLAYQHFGGFHGLFHVAGGSGRKFGDGPLHELSDEGFEKTLQLNLMSLVYSNRAAVKAFLQTKSPGVILNTSSTLAKHPSTKYFGTIAYPTAKAAINAFTRHNASYYAGCNIRFNAIAPGLTETPMAQRAITNDTIIQFAKSKQPLDGGRPARPDDLDAAVVYLLSDQSRFVTGQILAIDGGWSVSEGQYPQT